MASKNKRRGTKIRLSKIESERIARFWKKHGESFTGSAMLAQPWRPLERGRFTLRIGIFTPAETSKIEALLVRLKQAREHGQ